MADRPAHVERLEDGAFWRVVLGGSKGNILDARRWRRCGVFRRRRTPALKAICSRARAALLLRRAACRSTCPARCAAMLPRFHGAVRAHARQRRGRRWPPCAGSASAAASSWRASATASSRAPTRARPAGDRARRVRAGGSVVLAERIGRARAEDLCLTRPHRSRPTRRCDRPRRRGRRGSRRRPRSTYARAAPRCRGRRRACASRCGPCGGLARAARGGAARRSSGCTSTS